MGSSLHGGGVPSPKTPIDWEAYECLQQKISHTDDPFKVAAIDYALNKLLDSPSRAASGKRLADDLFRDGKRHIANLKRPDSKQNIRQQTFQLLLGDYEEGQLLVEPLADHVALVEAALNSLSPKEQMALYLKATNNDSPQLIKCTLDVGVRQFKNILQKVQCKLRSIAGFRESFFSLFRYSDTLIGRNSIFQLLENYTSLAA